MIAAWMVWMLAVGCLLAAAAACLHSLQRGADRPVRGVWAGAMVLLVVLAAAAPMRDGPAQGTRTVVGTSAAQITASSVPSTSPLHRLMAMTRSARRAIAAPIAGAVTVAARAARPVQHSLLAAWLLSSICAFVLLGRVWIRVRRLRRAWPDRVLHGTRVRVSPDAGPAVMGISPPEIVVPAWILARTNEEQRLVLAHEQQHVIANDPMLLLVACLAVAVMPWHPAMWYLWSRLRLAVELDCDRRVLRAGAAPLDYGRLLIDLTGHRSALSSGIPAFSYSATHLERRLLAMTSQPSRFVAIRRIGGTLVAALAILAACESNLPTSAEIRSMDVASATKRAVATGIDTAKVSYIVDGDRVTMEVADKVAAERIATIDVARGTGDSGAIVRVRTMRGDKVSIRMDTATKARTAFDGLLLVDGVVTESSRMNAIDPGTIVSVEVVKGAAAKAAFSDPRAANGVIKITTKKTP